MSLFKTIFLIEGMGEWRHQKNICGYIKIVIATGHDNAKGEGVVFKKSVP